MSESIETLLDQGLERYQAGEKAEDLIPFFKKFAIAPLKIPLLGVV